MERNEGERGRGWETETSGVSVGERLELGGGDNLLLLEIEGVVLVQAMWVVDVVHHETIGLLQALGRCGKEEGSGCGGVGGGG